MSDMSKYFCGTVSVQKFSQIVHLELIPVFQSVTDEKGNTTLNQTGLIRNLYTAKTEEQRFLFEGVPALVADNLSGSVTVTDISGKTYTVSFEPKIVDASSGTAVMEKENNAVTIFKTSPHLRTVEVVHRNTQYFCNNEEV